jgi:hypothetical protein
MMSQHLQADHSQQHGGAAGSPRAKQTHTSQSSDISLSKFSDQISTSVQNLMDVFEKYKEESPGYFEEQTSSGRDLLDEVSV